MSNSNSVKTIWITGASSGIGYDLALIYARNGSRVIASARNVEKLNALRQAAKSLSGEIVSMPLDVTQVQSVSRAVQTMQEKYATPDIVVFNAGYYEPLQLSELSFSHFEKTYAVNLHGVVYCLLKILPLFREQRHGHIVIVSSVAGYSGLPRATAYGSSKAALTHLAESIRLECLRDGIDISVVNPGFVKTPLTDLNTFTMPFILESADAADRMYRGIQSKKFEINFPRRFTWIMKLLRLLPYPLYFAITKKLL